MSEALGSSELKAVIAAACAGGKLRYRAQPAIGGLQIRKRGEASRTDSLVAVYLGQIRLMECPSANVLRADARRGSELVFESNTPLHEIRRVELTVGHCSNGDRRKTCAGICLRRRAGEPALRET